MSKELFTVGGIPVLKKALAERLKEEGFNIASHDELDSNYLRPSNHEQKRITSQDLKEPIHYQLPQDWQEAVEAFLNYYKEEELIEGRWYVTEAGHLFKFLEEKLNRLYYSEAFTIGTPPEYMTKESRGSAAYMDFSKSQVKLADPKLVEERLIQEAKKRGFKDDCRFRSLSTSDTWQIYGVTGFRYSPESDELRIWNKKAETINDGYVTGGGYNVIYCKGKWAELLPSTPDITINGYKAEFNEHGVQFGCTFIGKERLACLIKALNVFRSGDYQLNAFKFGNIEVSKEQIRQLNDYFQNKKS